MLVLSYPLLLEAISILLVEYFHCMYSQQAVPESKATALFRVRAPTSTHGAQEGLHYLDWLRMLAVLGVFYQIAA